MAQFPFVTDGTIGDVPTNWIPVNDPAKGVILDHTPGLLELCDLTDCTELRGLHTFENYLYAVARRGTESVLWRIASTGGFVEVGTITTSSTGPVWMVHNQTQMLIVDGVSGWVYTSSTGGLVQITDAAFPGASSCSYQDGYAILTFPSSNQWFFSALNDFTSYDASDFYSKEGQPDNIICILSDHREPWIFGEETSEVWYNAGGDNSSTSNPTFARNSGGLLEFGIAGAAAAAKWDNTVCWLSDKRDWLRGEGYNAKIVSNELFSNQVREYSTVSDAIAFTYSDSGHQFCQLTFPTSDVTWVIDAKTKLLHKRTSYKTNGDFGRHRANCYALMGGVHYVGDYENGKIYKMSMDYLSDNGEEIQRIVYSQDIYGGMKRLAFGSVQIEFEPGVGLVTGLDPQAMLQYSADGGKTWSSELWRSVGKMGDYSCRAVWNRMGSGFRRQYRLTVSDPVNWKIYSISNWEK